MKVVVLLLALCCFHQTSGETHSLKYFYTGTSGISNFPEFVTVLLVDNQPASYYDSIIREETPRQDWMKDATESDPDFWNRNTQISQREEQTFINNIDVAKKRFNQTGGVHVFQLMYGCQFDDATVETTAKRQYGYDGEDFISLDLKSSQWVAPVQRAVSTKDKWNNDKATIEGHKQYSFNICIDWLKKYLQYGSSFLERKVRPEVTLLQRNSEVVCHSTGFYPEGVMITWKRDGEEMQEDVDVGETLPNEDGTFQKRAVLTVSPEERKKGEYTCEVAHKSGAPIVMTLTVEDGNNLGIIIGCVAAAAVVIGVIVAIVAIVMRKKKDYKKAGQSDTESDNSNSNSNSNVARG